MLRNEMETGAFN